MTEKEWSENPEDDPVELQKKQLALGKKFLAKMEAQEAKEREREQAYQPAYAAVAPAYTPPTFEQTSERIKKAWDEVNRIMPDAPDQVKVRAFETLAHVSMMGGFGSL